MPSERSSVLGSYESPPTIFRYSSSVKALSVSVRTNPIDALPRASFAGRLAGLVLLATAMLGGLFVVRSAQSGLASQLHRAVIRGRVPRKP